jgi:hypothetical protein
VEEIVQLAKLHRCEPTYKVAEVELLYRELVSGWEWDKRYSIPLKGS